jgi:hypothetical protein
MKKLCFVAVATMILVSSKAQTLYVPSGTSGIGSSTNSNVGIGTTATPSAKLEVNQAGGGSGQNVGVKVWAGNTLSYFGNSQLQLSYGGGGGAYTQAIKSRHNSAAQSGNAIDFYLWRPGDNVNGEGSLNVMSLNGGNVGIGTPTPLYPLHVVAPSGNQGLRIGATGLSTEIALQVAAGNFGYLSLGGNTAIRGNGQLSMFEGNVGIGISPSQKLEVAGNFRVDGPGGTSHSEMQFYRADGVKFASIGQGILNAANSTFDIQHFNGNDIRFLNNGTEQVRILASNGNVGIGTTQPDYPLTVNGSIHAKEVRVDLNIPAPDYVFEKEYTLTSLDDIKTYIDQNKHLPEVPSAKEMEKNGVQLGEMNMILLKKIEELTLHAIEQQNMIEEMRRENQEMKKEINDLKTKK